MLLLNQCLLGITLTRQIKQEKKRSGLKERIVAQRGKVALLVLYYYFLLETSHRNKNIEVNTSWHKLNLLWYDANVWQKSPHDKLYLPNKVQSKPTIRDYHLRKRINSVNYNTVKMLVDERCNARSPKLQTQRDNLTNQALAYNLLK